MTNLTRGGSLLHRFLRLGLGALFCYAGINKHLAVADFAEAILAYQLLPQNLVGLMAAVIPWLEMTVGGLLVLVSVLPQEFWPTSRFHPPWFLTLSVNLTRRSCLLLIILQLGLFFLVLVITMGRGLKIDCGCGLFSDRPVGLAALLEDALLLSVAAWLYFEEFKMVPGRPGGRPTSLGTPLPSP